MRSPSGAKDRRVNCYLLAGELRDPTLPDRDKDPAWMGTGSMPLDVGLEIQRRRAELGAYNRWIVAELSPFVGRSVLDVGCGTGNLLEFFLDRDRVMGIDIGDDFIELARKRFADRPNLRVEVGDITDPSMCPSGGGVLRHHHLRERARAHLG